jgi:hypothetical protein
MAEWNFRIYEFADLQGESIIRKWLDARNVTSRDRKLLLAKTDMLAAHGAELLGGLLAGPIKSKTRPRAEKHIYKMVIHGSVMLRPLLCKGPFDMNNEFTLLLGAIETGGVLDEDAWTAEINRQIVIADPARRLLNGRYK